MVVEGRLLNTSKCSQDQRSHSANLLRKNGPPHWDFPQGVRSICWTYFRKSRFCGQRKNTFLTVARKIQQKLRRTYSDLPLPRYACPTLRLWYIWVCLPYGCLDLNFHLKIIKINEEFISLDVERWDAKKVQRVH
jgi:hypothetical protein